MYVQISNFTDRNNAEERKKIKINPYLWKLINPLDEIKRTVSPMKLIFNDLNKSNS